MIDRPSFLMRSLYEIIKFPISLWVALSAAVGYSLGLPEPDSGFWLTLGSVFLLSAGSAGINNIQDRQFDRQLARTRQRPLASGRLPLGYALVQSSLLVLAGTWGLCLTRNGALAACLGWLGIGLYNGIYTPMKHRSMLAVLPGALCGAIPVAIGWAAAGRGMHGGQGVMAVMAVMSVWQLPHFWLVVLTHANDYSRPWIPSMLTVFSVRQLERILLAWIALFSAMMLMVPLYGISPYPSTMVVLGVNALTVQFFFIFRHMACSHRRYRLEFAALNISMMLFMSGLLADRMINGIT